MTVLASPPATAPAVRLVRIRSPLVNSRRGREAGLEVDGLEVDGLEVDGLEVEGGRRGTSATSFLVFSFNKLDAKERLSEIQDQ